MKKNIVDVLAIVLFCISPVLNADGGFVSFSTTIVGEESTFTPIVEKGQQAFVYFDETAGIERLVVEARTGSFSGDFAWFVPVPYVPTDIGAFLATAVDELPNVSEGFSTLHEATAPGLMIREYVTRTEYETRGFLFGCSAMGEAFDTSIDAETKHDTELDEPAWASKTTANLTLHLLAGSVEQIGNWFSANHFGSLTGEQAEIFSAYESADGFSLLVVTGRENTASEFHTGLGITFPASRPFFPMKISSIGSGATMDLVVYVCSGVSYAPQGNVKFYSAQITMSGFHDNLFAIGNEEPISYVIGTDFIESGLLRFGDEDVPGERFDVYLDEVLARYGLASTGSLPIDHFWLQCSTSFESGTIPFVSDMIPSGRTLVLNRFKTTFYGREHAEYAAHPMADIVFTEQAAMRPFRGWIEVRVLVREGAVSSAIPDLNLVLVLAFPIGLKLAQVIRALRRRFG